MPTKAHSNTGSFKLKLKCCPVLCCMQVLGRTKTKSILDPVALARDLFIVNRSNPRIFLPS